MVCITLGIEIVTSDSVALLPPCGTPKETGQAVSPQATCITPCLEESRQSLSSPSDIAFSVFVHSLPGPLVPAPLLNQVSSDSFSPPTDWLILVSRIKPRALHVLGKCPSTELSSWPQRFSVKDRFALTLSLLLTENQIFILLSLCLLAAVCSCVHHAATALFLVVPLRVTVCVRWGWECLDVSITSNCWEFYC